MLLLRLIAALGGVAIVLTALSSALRNFVLPRSAIDPTGRALFRALRAAFALRLRYAPDYASRDRIMALYAPIGLLLLLATWMTMVLVGFALIFWASGIPSPKEALVLSGSSLLTLGYASGTSLPQALLSFVEALVGLILIALLIAYLPTMYGAFAQREHLVTLLEVRAGAPPSAVEMIARYHRLNRLPNLSAFWDEWERWFAEIEESHTSLPALVFFRSPQANHSWVTAAGAVLDAASLVRALVAVPTDPQADLTIRAGFLAMRRIAATFGLRTPEDPRFPRDPISVTRAEFDAACAHLASQGVPLRADRERAWQDFGGWRVNYDAVLLALCRLTLAPSSPWAGDRAAAGEVGRGLEEGQR